MVTPETPAKQPTCFVIMPISDLEGYDKGHFGRVYDHLIKPACERAGFLPIRADDTTKTNYIAIDILRAVVESDLVLCDLSARNPNVLYELGIRQAFNLPVVLIKDLKTEKIFDIQGLRYTEYDQTLRVDTVQRDIGRVSLFLSETAKSMGNDVNSIIQLLGLRQASLPEKIELSNDSSVILSAVEDLGMRLTDIESQLRSGRIITDEFITLADSSTASLGDTLYIGTSSVGVLIEIQADALRIRNSNRGDLIERIPYGSKRFEALLTVPF